MVFVKVVKNKAFFKRYQVKYRRRREGKTDYHARRRLVLQDKNKYGSPKYRFVVRLTNRKIICQIVYSVLIGDKILCAADSTELINYGIKVGFTNYAAAYATGLLVARRLLKKLKLDDKYVGLNEATGKEFHIEENESSQKPFKCILDVGIVNTTTGNRVFGAMKGACDGGLHIPHNTKRFPGFKKMEGSNKNGEYTADEHRERIFGLHIVNYMRTLQEENSDKYTSHFSEYIKHNINPDDIENIYTIAHKLIREKPDRLIKQKKHIPLHVREGDRIKTYQSSYIRKKKLSSQQRKERVQKKLQMIAEMAAAAASAE